MQLSPSYPTREHQLAADAVVEFFAREEGVEAVALTGSCARGKATRDSCLDITVLMHPEAIAHGLYTLRPRWDGYYAAAEVFGDLRGVGRFSHVDLDFSDGCFAPGPRDWTSGPDGFELAVGNTLAYAVPLAEQGNYLSELRKRWLPFYGGALRQERLAEVVRYCRNNLNHVPLYVGRGLYFQSFKRLYDASREFLQALFIARRTYPIAYDKWIREQVEDILGLSELYPRLVRLFEIQHFESDELVHKARDVELLLVTYVEGQA